MTAEPVVRAAGPADDVDGVVRAAFGEEGAAVASIWAEVAGGPLERASFVAEHDGAVVGHVGLSHAWLDARERLVDVWLLSPLSVHPGRQGRGLGAALVAAALDAARSAGAPMVVLEGDPGFYGACGFERGSARGLEAPTRRTPEAAFQVALLPGHEDWMTGRVVYPDVWWRHDAAGLRDPLLAELEERLR